MRRGLFPRVAAASSLLALCVVVLLLATAAQAMRVTGSLDKDDNWVFVAKFCYDIDSACESDEPDRCGSVSLDYQSEEAMQHLAVYDDQGGSWDGAYHTNKTCDERLVPYPHGPAKVVLPLAETPKNGGWVDVAEVFREATRPRFWYFVLSNCEGGRVVLDYDLELVQPASWGWQRQFSCEEQGLLTTYIVFFFILLAVGGLHTYATNELRRTDSYHVVVKMVSTAVAVSVLSAFCDMIHYALYSHDGYGSPGFKGMATVMTAVGDLTMILLLIVLSQGWTISNQHLRNKRAIMVLFMAFTLAYFILFVWLVAIRDSASNVYVMDTPPGVTIMVLRSLSGVWFFAQIISTRKAEQDPEKRNFYLFLTVFFGLWFFLLPLVVAIASALSPWVRLRIVASMTLAVSTMGVATMTGLFWHTRAQRYFSITRGSGAENAVMDSGSSPYDEL